MDKTKQIAQALITKLLEIRNESPEMSQEKRMIEALKRMQEANPSIYMGVRMPSDKPRCSECGRILAKREISLYKGIYRALGKVYKMCVEKKKHEFDMKEIREIIGGHNEYARFGDWVYFGGLVYKKGKSHYGINIPRVEDFFFKESKIAISGYKDPITKEFTPTRWGTKDDIPGLSQFLNAEGLYEAKYTQADLGL